MMSPWVCSRHKVGSFPSSTAGSPSALPLPGSALRGPTRGGSDLPPKRGGAVLLGFGERPPDTIGVEIGAVHRRSRLLPPGFVQAPGVDPVESQLVQQADDDV